MIKNEGNVAAILVEPVVGTNGVLVPPKEYLPMLREIASKHDVLLIADEVMSGWGRTGEWFAVDNWNVKPDILSTAKGITGAYVPLGLTATTKEIADYFDEHYFAHGHTYEAHPLALAAGIATIREYQRLDLVQEAKKRGRYLGRRLNELRDEHKSIGDVRGLGLFWAVELVKNKLTKQPFYEATDKLAGRPSLLDNVGAEMMKNGVFLTNWMTHLVIAPPLIITDQQIDEGVDALDKALRLTDESAD
jgi:taurine--2-oxoglutarate transaminase